MRWLRESHSGRRTLLFSVVLAVFALSAMPLRAEARTHHSRSHRRNNVVARGGGRVGNVVDPGVRAGAAGAGDPVTGLTETESAMFDAGLDAFSETDEFTNADNVGLGPRFNLNSCVGCHLQPAVGGSTPLPNPQTELFTEHLSALDGVTVVPQAVFPPNVTPWFVVPNGPAREARFVLNPDGTADGGVHDLFTVSGRPDAPECVLAQPDFGRAGDPVSGQGGNPNVIFRIPTPTFGLGLVESISDQTIRDNMAANAAEKAKLGISGHPNTNGNDGTITRFGWKAQNKSLLLFAGEAYNVEVGVTNDIFTQERDETAGCVVNSLPEDETDAAASGTATFGDITLFAGFMKFLAAPTAVTSFTTASGSMVDSTSIESGRALFESTGCALCHTPSLTSASSAGSAALSSQPVNLFSDLLVHHMGVRLADNVSQGAAGPDEFRSAPLWGVGQRIFFLHDGRTSNIVKAILAHASKGSEANGVIRNFLSLTTSQQQDIVNFLRSL